MVHYTSRVLKSCPLFQEGNIREKNVVLDNSLVSADAAFVLAELYDVDVHDAEHPIEDDLALLVSWNQMLNDFQGMLKASKSHERNG